MNRISDDKDMKWTESSYMPPMVTVAQVRSEKAGIPSPGPVAALM